MSSKKNKRKGNPKKGGTWLKDLLKFWKEAIAVASGLSVLLPLIFLVWPNLKPSGPPEKVRATLEIIEVGPEITLGRYMDQYLQQPEKPNRSSVEEARDISSEEDLQRVGKVVKFSNEIIGFSQEQCCSVSWSVFTADTHEPVEGLSDQPAWPTPTINPEQQSDRYAVFETWVPLPEHSEGPFKVVVNVYSSTENATEILRDTKTTSL